MKPDDHSSAARADSFEQRWRKRFEQFAGSSDDDAGIAGWSVTGLEVRLRNFARTWPGSPPGALWLDAGCGAGTYSRFLADRKVGVVGLDYSLPTIGKAKQRGGADVFWGVADVTRLPVKTGVFDGALCFGVMQALSAPAPAVRELARAVRPGGTIWIDALNAGCLPTFFGTLWRRMTGRPAHLRYDRPGALRATMLENGFRSVRIHWLPILPGRWRKFQHLVETPAMRRAFRHVPLLGALFSHAFVVEAER